MKLEIKTTQDKDEFLSMNIVAETPNDRKIMSMIIDTILENAQIESEKVEELEMAEDRA